VTRINFWQYQDALADCNTALAISQKHDEAYYYRGKVHLTLHQYAEDLEDFHNATRLRPENKEYESLLRECQSFLHTEQDQKSSKSNSPRVVKG
jgi:tetratricopeptide (TPR) repeat protein